MSDVAKTGYSRVFLIDGGAKPSADPVYQTYTKAGGVSKGYGDITSIENPSATQYDQFDEIDTIKGAQDRATLDLMSRYLMDVASEMLRIAEQGCGVDVQVHFGACTDPTAFNVFKKALIMEDAYISDWSTDDLGAIESGDRNPVMETGSISASRIYEALQLSVAEVAASVVTNEVLDVVICDTVACGECDETSNGCQHVYAITKAAGGSPGTPADIVFTTDDSTWYADDIDSLGAAEDPSAIGCVGDYIVVVSNASGSAHYALKSEVNDVDYDETWTEIATGFTDAPNDCWKAVGGRYLYICGDGGYIYRTDDITEGVTAVESAAATTNDLNAIHMLSDTFGVAVGDNDSVLLTEDGTNWSLVTGGTGSGVNLNCVWVIDEMVWLIGTAGGTLYYTVDKGANFSLKGFPGSGSGAVYDIAFASNSVGYLAHTTAAGAGRILRTFSGGNSWVVLPEGTGTIPSNDRIVALAACINDVNLIFGVGLGADGTDGIIVRGAD
jgi:photosystem II stability/assembly factor-like uncharacterized protein